MIAFVQVARSLWVSRLLRKFWQEEETSEGMRVLSARTTPANKAIDRGIEHLMLIPTKGMDWVSKRVKMS